MRKQASPRCRRAGHAVLQGGMGNEGDGESELTEALGNSFSVSLGSLMFPSQHSGLSLCTCSVPSPSSHLTLLTHHFSSLTISADLYGLLSPVFAQAFCYTTHYHQWQFSSESLCSNPRKNLIFLIPLYHRSQA